MSGKIQVILMIGIMKVNNNGKRKESMSKKNIEWVCIDQWYCNDCQTYIDDNVELMEMHECKKNKQKKGKNESVENRFTN